ncbi:MAG TPA: WYL domain-containing protein [Kofleriaceae bacterium]|nr:WYL domain-containing protein [Kofleriaceae bacterium]
MRASRLVSILMMLQSRGRVSARTLADHLEVSTRTVYRDIDELSASGVPVVVERGSAGGFELLEGWRTTLTGLTPHESQTLFLSGLPGPVAELGLGDTMASAHLKLLAALPRAWQLEAQRVSSRFHVDLAGWYRRVKPVAHLRALADAVWADRWVAIRYESWEGVVDRELEPLGLVIKAGEWYLAALPRHGRARARGRVPTPRTYRVSNIRELTVQGEFTRAPEFDLSAYWSESTRRFERDIYRTTADIRLSPRGRKLLRNENAAVEDAIDRAAEATDDRAADGGWLRVTIPIESINHAAGQLLALGSDVEVLGPPELRDRVRDTARAVAATYEVSPAAPRPRARARRSRRRNS